LPGQLQQSAAVVHVLGGAEPASQADRQMPAVPYRLRTEKLKRKMVFNVHFA
jgi:hypothetical protein